MIIKSFIFCTGLLLLIPQFSFAQIRTLIQLGENRDESKVPRYTLPDPLELLNGEKVEDVKTWVKLRRPEIFKMFAEEVYGKAPGKPENMTFEVLESNDKALDGRATRKQVAVYFASRKELPHMVILIYIPNNRQRAAPAFMGLNFYGNQSIIDDPAVYITKSWVNQRREVGVVNNRATEASRGVRSYRWPVKRIVKRGYALATIHYGDIDPDYFDRFLNGVHGLYPQPKADEWGSISAWAWGLSRAMDYFETCNDIDEKRVAVMGHSRLGKTALWAGASDERFALVISNNSGCGGAALSRRVFGNYVAQINYINPHWFCDNFTKYNDKENELPVDQHMLIALMAPRPVYVASAEEDLHADPKGEFLAAKNAAPVYRLFGKDCMPDDAVLEKNKPIVSSIGYHLRDGKHNVTDYDWDRYLDFADLHMK
jgi:hypothetical protein